MKRVLLVGGGHAHVEVIRQLGGQRPLDTEVVLVSPAPDTPYSGMLPGLVAGHYTWRECHIDLAGLCLRSNVVFRQGAVVEMDAKAGIARLGDGYDIAFQFASLDVGSTPPVRQIEGAGEYGVTVKPVNFFLEVWEAVLAEAQQRALRITVVGGGAGGVELALALRHRLDTALADTRPCDVTVVTQGARILPDHAEGVRRRVEAALRRSRVGLLTGARVERATAEGLVLANGAIVPSDCAVWTTGAAAPQWLRGTGLALDDEGFVLVDDTLRSVSHPHVFAAGDVASMLGRPRPKSGVYAVRQGPPLAENIRRVMAGKQPKRFPLQRKALALISTGPRHAIASRGALSVEGGWVWRWKDRIDRGFMAKYAG